MVEFGWWLVYTLGFNGSDFVEEFGFGVRRFVFIFGFVICFFYDRG